jgi:SAM-dependent methyltransferase
MPFRTRFDCLWCGRSWTTRGPDDLEGWAQLCADCLGKAGTNEFLRVRLRAGLDERARTKDQPPRSTAPVIPPGPTLSDDWYLRRGSFSMGPVDDTTWAAELDELTQAIDWDRLAPPFAEPAAGVGFWSPLLASHGELWAWDHDAAALERARDRLVAHGLTAHLDVGDAFTAPGGDHLPVPPAFGAVVAAWVLGRVGSADLAPLVGALAGRVAAGGRLIAIDLLGDPRGGTPEGWMVHRLDALASAFQAAELHDVQVRATRRFFSLITGVR